MARFTREELESFRDRPVVDLIGPGLRLLFVGINPGLWTAATNTHFCHPSNRFYPALGRAGLIDWDLDPEVGMTDAQRRDFIVAGLGITNLVNRATVRASELGPEELREGVTHLTRLVSELRPAMVAVAGVTAYRTAFARPRAQMGRQPEGLESAELWVVPNPSGLNAHETVDSLADWYRRAALAAGVL
jgi:TDG/mug DNA glycosylase family protein